MSDLSDFTAPYNEGANIAQLEQLSVAGRTMFALLVAYRLLPAYRRFHEATAYGSADDLEAAAAALTYAIRSRLSGSADDAALSGRMAYEALDAYVQARVGGMSFDEEATRQSPAVIAEVNRQRRDLSDLLEWERSGSPPERLRELRDHAMREARDFFGTDP